MTCMGRNDAVAVPTKRRVYTYDPKHIDFNLPEGEAHTIGFLGYHEEIFVRELREKNITLQLCEHFRNTVEPLMTKDGGVTVEDPAIYGFRYGYDTWTMTLCLCLKCNDTRFQYEMRITMTKPSYTSDERMLTIALPPQINIKHAYECSSDGETRLEDLFGLVKAFKCSLNDFSLENLKDTVGTNAYSNHTCIIWKKLLLFLTLTSLADSGDIKTTSVPDKENTYKITAQYGGYNALLYTDPWTNTITISAVFTAQPTPLVEVTHDDSEYTNTWLDLSKYKPPLTETYLKMWTASELKQFILKFREKKPLRSMLADLNHRMDIYFERLI
jgi:hypothetical protein